MQSDAVTTRSSSSCDQAFGIVDPNTVGDPAAAAQRQVCILFAQGLI